MQRLPSRGIEGAAVSPVMSDVGGDGGLESDATEPLSQGNGASEATVLVVDDDPAVLHVASRVLRRGGYNVLEASGGAEALRVVEQMEGKIDLLLTDVVMPGMNGRALSETLRSLYPNIRILFMSGYTEDEAILEGIRVAELQFIAKPFTIDGLRAKVREVLNTP